MTDEHVPPRSTDNAEPVRRVVDPFDPESVLQEVSEWAEGHVLSTLCTECNHRASRWGYVGEYRRWYDLMVEQARQQVVARPTVNPLRGGEAFPLALPYDVNPARFVRQVIGMFLAVQATEHLFASCPALSELVDGDPSEPTERRESGVDIAPFRLSVCTVDAGLAYMTTPAMTVRTPTTSQRQRLWVPPGTSSTADDLLVLMLRPFVFLLASSGPAAGLDVSDWTSWSVSQRPRKNARLLRLPTVDQIDPILRAVILPGQGRR